MNIEKELMNELAENGTDKARDLFLKWQENRIQAKETFLSKLDQVNETDSLPIVRASLSGVELISLERSEQIEKHGRTTEIDRKLNTINQLSYAASALVSFIDGETIEISAPPEWDEDVWQHMMGKSYKERLIIAGALIAAEIDRVV
jgi:hypothetical protein